MEWTFDHTIWTLILLAAAYITIITRLGFSGFKLMSKRMRSSLRAHTIAAIGFGFALCIWTAYFIG